MNALDLSGKTIVITGACGALGTIIIRRLCELGARVAALDVIEPEVAIKELADFGDKTRYYKCDTADENQVRQTLKKVVQEMSVPQIVCCHAGLVHLAPVQDYSLKDFDELMRVNVRGSFVLAQAAVRLWLS
jgi:NAD(P)-dependent dehydrogenase (short-subunit alcohol dehydrogenase family)